MTQAMPALKAHFIGMALLFSYVIALKGDDAGHARTKGAYLWHGSPN
jgi:hypothetical protein